jgi:hypothetical protein
LSDGSKERPLKQILQQLTACKKKKISLNKEDTYKNKGKYGDNMKKMYPYKTPFHFNKKIKLVYSIAPGKS